MGPINFQKVDYFFILFWMKIAGVTVRCITEWISSRQACIVLCAIIVHTNHCWSCILWLVNSYGLSYHAFRERWLRWWRHRYSAVLLCILVTVPHMPRTQTLIFYVRFNFGQYGFDCSRLQVDGGKQWRTCTGPACSIHEELVFNWTYLNNASWREKNERRFSLTYAATEGSQIE